MVAISENMLITMSRGDSAEFPIFINSGSKLHPIQYELKESDKVTFYLTAPHQKFEDAIIEKEYHKSDVDEDGNVVVKFVPGDTVNLLPGVYYYQVKLQESESVIKTIVTKRKFTILD